MKIKSETLHGGNHENGFSRLILIIIERALDGYLMKMVTFNVIKK